MDWQLALIYGIGVLLILLAIGLEIPFAIGLVAITGLLIFEGNVTAINAFQSIAFTVSTSFTLLAVPLFILMGHILMVCGFGAAIYEAGSKWAGRMPGGLAIGTIIGSAFFGAVTGSGIAGTATIGKVSIPELRQRGYSDKVIYAAISAVGTLAALIPPSLAMVVYGDFTSTSISKLFFAGFIPGIMLASLMSIYIIGRGIFQPHLVPAGVRVPWLEKFKSLKGLWQLIIVAVVILGGIYSGLTTPTEAAGVGVMLSLILSLATRRLTFAHLKEASIGAVRTTTMILFIVMAALTLKQFWALQGVTHHISDIMINMGGGLIGLLVLYIILFMILGCFMDGMSIMVLTLPLLFPVFMDMGMSPLVLGVVTVIMIELGTLTPPVAFHLYVIKDIAGAKSIGEVAIGAIPTVAIHLVLVALIIAFPFLSTWIPDHL